MRIHSLMLAIAALLIPGARGSSAHAQTAPTAPTAKSEAAQDWAWFMGKWKVHHRKLRSRLTGDTNWDEFEGTSVAWETLGGQGNVDDNWLNAPGGAYRGLTLRSFDPGTGEWLIWWLDSRSPTVLEVPVRGRFKDGVGTFTAKDQLRGKPILVRFIWSGITKNSARWEQAFSPDDGRTWEVNWVMDFTRVE